MATRSRPPAAAVDPEAVLSHRFPEVSFAYDERDVALYALGVGACGADAVDEKELHLVYHRDGQPHIKALPTFASLFPFKNNNGLGIVNVPGLNFDASLLLHGQQYIEIYKPIPSGANIVNKFKVAGLHDKGKATILEIETTSHVKDSGEVLCMNRSTLYLRGAGGFSDSSRPYSYVNYPINQVPRIPIPNSAPSAVYEDQTQQSQVIWGLQSFAFRPYGCTGCRVHSSNTAWSLFPWVRDPRCHQIFLPWRSNSSEKHLWSISSACLSWGNFSH